MISKPIVRRTLVGGFVAAMTALASMAARAAEKASKQEAKYRDTPEGILSCGTCTFFIAPNACTIVNGAVTADGYCELYAQVD